MRIMNILKALPELVGAEVITQETADRINTYYKNRAGQSPNRLFIVFGILGAILIGLGIILIMAHNWDELSRSTKTVFAFLPLLAGQLICGYTLIKKPDSTAWRESGAAFLFFTVGASISLVSQIYNIPGDLGPFLLTWMILCLPLIYVMKSSATSLLYIIGITYFAGETGYWFHPPSASYPYWLLLAGVLPHYYFLFIEKPESNFTVFHHWLVPFSLLLAFGTIAHNSAELIFVAYFSLFGLFYLTGNSASFKKRNQEKNAFKTLGSLGTIILLFIFSFDWFWDDLRRSGLLFSNVFTSPEFFVSVITTALAAALLYIQQNGRPLSDIKPISVVFILFIAAFITGLYSPAAVVLINLVIFAIGIFTIRDGVKQNNLVTLNSGMLIITALIISRFFDVNLSFIGRGILFVLVGAGFIAANYWMLKKRNKNEQ